MAGSFFEENKNVLLIGGLGVAAFFFLRSSGFASAGPAATSTNDPNELGRLNILSSATTNLADIDLRGKIAAFNQQLGLDVNATASKIAQINQDANVSVAGINRSGALWSSGINGFFTLASNALPYVFGPASSAPTSSAISRPSSSYSPAGGSYYGTRV